MATNYQLSVPDLCNAYTLQRFIYTTEAGSPIIAATSVIYTIIGASATLIDFSASIVGSIATGTDRQVTVLLQKAGGVPVSLTSDILFDSNSILNVSVSGSILIGGLVAGDVIEAKVAVSGALAAQATGLRINFRLDEVM